MSAEQCSKTYVTIAQIKTKKKQQTPTDLKDSYSSKQHKTSKTTLKSRKKNTKTAIAKYK